MTWADWYAAQVEDEESGDACGLIPVVPCECPPRGEEIE